MKLVRCLCLLALCMGTAVGRARAEGPTLQLTWGESDHASGIYHPAETARLGVLVENTTSEPQPLAGEITFGAPSDGGAGFKPISVTPITPTSVAPGQRAKLPLMVSFANAGPYELRWRANAKDPGVVISSAANLPLTCIFAPRTPPQPITAVRRVSPWVLPLPAEAAKLPNYLTDLAKQTSVASFLLDEPFRYDPDTRLALAVGAGLDASAEQLDALFTEAAALRSGGEGGILLRVTLPVSGNENVPTILGAYITDAHQRLHGALHGIVLVPQVPDDLPLTAALRDRFHVLYLAAYKAAKAADKNIVMLGAGSAAATDQWLIAGDSLAAYVDAVAVGDAEQCRQAHALVPGRPLWLLPPGAYHWGDTPAAAALAEGASMVGLPAPAEDRGVTAHLLGGSVLFQNLSDAHAHPEEALAHRAGLPWMAVFQGDHFAVAAIAGLGAGTPLDLRYPGLAAGKTVIDRPSESGDPAYPNIRVPNDLRSLRVVDAQGATIDCAVGDDLYVPAGDKLVYLLAPGNAEDLAAILRPAPVARVPVFDFTLAIPPDVGGEGGGGLTLRLTNISDKARGGTVRVFRPTGDETRPPEPLATRVFDPVAAGDTREVFLDAGTSVKVGQPLVLEFVTPGLTQRTGLILH